VCRMIDVCFLTLSVPLGNASGSGLPEVEPAVIGRCEGVDESAANVPAEANLRANLPKPAAAVALSARLATKGTRWRAAPIMVSASVPATPLHRRPGPRAEAVARCARNAGTDVSGGGCRPEGVRQVGEPVDLCLLWATDRLQDDRVRSAAQQPLDGVVAVFF
jgi:hypothetical protein